LPKNEKKGKKKDLAICHQLNKTEILWFS